MTTISDEFAAQIVTKIRADVETIDELSGGAPADPRDLLLLKLYDDVQAIKRGVSFLGVGGGIKPVTRAA